ncbi:MAG: DUF3604 domain-containing protein [Acidobacteria bacterium]|nr:MAG: DUF3604 domain-containing protein [Acidobacteriota bacterium]REK05872.1 MAG: DUF3604 domain-containing protein [Acidobacteriota bacterium]
MPSSQTRPRRSPSTRRFETATTVALLAALLAAGCGDDSGSPADGDGSASTSETPAPNPLRNAYFGELHVHTKHSFDAYLFGVRETPDAAYRFAKGEAIPHPSGYEMQMDSGPLDFQAVTDHAFYLGVVPAMYEQGSPTYDTTLAAELRELGVAGGFQRALVAMGTGEMDEVDSPEVRASAWRDVVEAAERHNDPGRFTTFIGYEYTSSTDDRGNLHRNVIFRGSEVPELPFSRNDSQDPEGLWDWLDQQRAQGRDAIAIPHNSNGSNGAMFQLSRFDGSPFDASYAEKRMRNEPIIELSQIKGTSEVHPMLSPNDEWADFEIFPFRIATELYSEPKGSYAREALRNGLVLEEELGYNPFRFGFVAASDSHNAAGLVEEDNYVSKVGAADGTAQLRGSVPLDEPREDGSQYAASKAFPLFGAAGLAGVWAEENTRESLFEAMRRKETFATSGPRIRIRFFAGYGYLEDLLGDPEMVAKAYAGGVPMGGDLLSGSDPATNADTADIPRLLAWAVGDPDSAPLQRLQIVKVWLDAEEGPSERVYDVACSDGAQPDAVTHRCPDNGATVDLGDCSISQGVGAAELKALWTDPDFSRTERALYYVRVLENPTCRWSTWDAIRAGVEPREGLAKTIQERAWSSPIWYVP